MNNVSNGLESFSFHALEPAPFDSSLAIEPSEYDLLDLINMDSEVVAKEYLKKAFESADIKHFDAPEMPGKKVSFEIEKIERMPLTNTKVVKFRQYVNSIVVYGSLITVELDENKKLLSIFSAMNSDIKVSSIADISPRRAIETVEEYYKIENINVTPLLYYYYLNNSPMPDYKLVYIIKNISVSSISEISDKDEINFSKVIDCVIDAHTGEVIDEIPKEIFNCLTDPNIDGQVDELDNFEEVLIDYPEASGGPATFALQDDELRIITHDFEYKNVYDTLANRLPGSGVISLPPPRFKKPAVDAHQNTRKVAKFIKEKLKRRGIDDNGLPYISTVNCCTNKKDKTWLNAAWSTKYSQIVYGQVKIKEKWISYASSLDTVAHEVFHGITAFTAKLEGRGMPGALNESYSDIFAIIVVNYYREDIDWADISKWTWELGKDVSKDGTPLRDLSNPSKYGYAKLCPTYPSHMNEYQYFPMDIDMGGIHINSNIHNKAAFNLMNSSQFTPDELIELFFSNLEKYLLLTSTFQTSLRGMINTARTQFKNRSQNEVDNKVEAIYSAFTSVGITL